MFQSLSSRITQAFHSLRGKGVLSEADVDATVSDIRKALLDADVALPVVRQFAQHVREKAAGSLRTKALNPSQQVIKIVHHELIDMLGGETRELHYAQRGPTVFMLAGLQGAGKTTLAGKLAHWLKDQNKRVLLGACDLQRPQAVAQLTIMAERAGADIWAPAPGNGVGDPVNVARQGLREAIEKGYDIFIVDTAGRLGVDEEMMQQARAISDAVHPHETLFVLDAMIGQDAVATAEAFRDGVGFSGVVLSKLDGDARGGAALSVRGVTGVPILFASTGEGLNDFERFHADRMASRILDMGDMLTLIEQAEKTYDAQQAEKLAGKMAQGNFTLDDFLHQLHQIQKMGSLKKIMGMLPGAGQFRQQLESFDESQIGRIEAIVYSMTPAERADVKLLNGSRRQRIARGSGTTVQEINSLVKRFEQAQKMMRHMARGSSMPSLSGGMGQLAPTAGLGFGMGGHSGSKKQRKSKNKKKRKFGNPAKQRAFATKKDKESSQLQGAAFGLKSSPSSSQSPQETIDDLPEEVRKMLGHF